MNQYTMVELGTLISQAKTVRCGNEEYPVLSMTMRNGLVFQDDKFKKVIASKDKSEYKVVERNQLVISFPIDEGVLATQRIVDAGIVSPAYGIWDVNQEKILPEYLEYALRCERALSYYRAKLRGSTARRRSLPTPTLLEFRVPLPSIVEQKRIIEVVNKVKDIILYRQDELKQLDELIKARFVEMFGDIVVNTHSLPAYLLKDLALLITKGASPNWQGFNYIEDEEQTLFITSENVREGYLDFSKSKYIEDGFNEKQKRSVLQKGDFLINIVGASIGRAAQFKIDKKANINQAVALVRVEDERIVDGYLLEYLNSEKALQMYFAMQSDTGRANLSLEDIGNLVILLPPVNEQRIFDGFVQQINKSKVVVQKALDEAQTLFDSLMQEYFG